MALQEISDILTKVLLFSADPDDPLKTTDQTRPLGLIVWFLLSTYFQFRLK